MYSLESPHCGNLNEYTQHTEENLPKLTITIFHLALCAGLGGSFGCAVRLETRRSRVQPPPRSATFFRGDRS